MNLKDKCLIIAIQNYWKISNYIPILKFQLKLMMSNIELKRLKSQLKTIETWQVHTNSLLIKILNRTTKLRGIVYVHLRYIAIRVKNPKNDYYSVPPTNSLNSTAIKTLIQLLISMTTG